MQITDPVADMLTRIRNANSAKHDTVECARFESEEGDGTDPAGRRLYQVLHGKR